MSDTSKRYLRINELFQAAVDLSPAERASLLERECAGDDPLRREVEAFLAADAENDGFIEDPILSFPADLLNEEDEGSLVGQQLGPYRITREIGRGGLGAVYLAARADDEYRKEVAIKLIRRGLDTDDILRRFRNERQILAQLDHPNIARLLDGGTTSDGLPYFVMEYVPGEPIDRYCAAQKLRIEERLELFRKVCAAVTYAHQHLVVHRDLKPSNILVTAEGEPKLLDFGIAKLLTVESEMFTQTVPDQRLLTRDYASPEQIRGEKITTASDVYSLGVLLYELLSGQKPYRLKTGSAEEMSRAIAEQEPQRPSTAVAGNRESRIENRKFLQGDLDNIVLKALRKEPERRYSSPENLAEDIRRHQQGLPVSARANTLGYRAGKFIQRNRVGVFAGLLVLLAIIAGFITTQRQSRIAQNERAKAENRFRDVRKLANSYLFDVYPEIENLAGSLKAREAILRNALTYLDSLAREAVGDSELASELATAYEKVGDVQGALNTSNLGNMQAGLASYAKARTLREGVQANNPRSLEATERLANNLYTTARTLWTNSQTKKAEETFEKALNLERELVAAQPDSVVFKNRLALLLIDYGAIPVFNFQSDKAIVLFDEALGIIRSLRQKDPDDSDLKKTHARGLRIVSKAKSGFGDHAGGIEALNEALVLSKELAGQFPQDFRLQRSVWLTESLTCELLIDQGDGKEGVAYCEKTIAFPAAALRDEPENGVVAYDLAVSHFNTARASRLAENPAGTVAQANAAIEVMSKLSAKSPDNNEYKRNLAIYRTELARALNQLNQPLEAIDVLAEVEKNLQPIIAADPGSTTYRYDLGFAHRLSAQAFYKTGDKARALEHADKATALLVKLKEAKALRESDKNILAELERERAEYAR